MGFVVPTVIAGFADCLRLWHILVQQTEVRAPRRPVVAARLLDAVSSWQTCKRWLTIRAGYKGPLGFHNHGEGHVYLPFTVFIHLFSRVSKKDSSI